ncbi:hypothetical protein NP233_g668 [Leucocoprinus birnbaumii]|uniref:Late embryogenesis abundant protein LEA-2 subgroup domain-containing protein n=1 Tax=Leucocoprinus birnbaumii TaxID=56174 RepID=A0AAD5Z041_9AGAR|nr:hypothetical protein NP233_g668 [Leucocoprinus birnbaumii]
MARAFFCVFVAFLYTCVFAAPASKATSIEGFSIGEIINLLGIGLVTGIHVNITLDSLTTNLVSIDFDVKNPLPFELTIDSISSSAGVNSTQYAAFDYTFDSGLVVPPLGTKNSGVIDNVLLTQGALASLDIIPLGYLDLLDTDANIRAATILGHLGIPIPLDGLKQKTVPTTYDLVLS